MTNLKRDDDRDDSFEPDETSMTPDELTSGDAADLIASSDEDAFEARDLGQR